MFTGIIQMVGAVHQVQTTIAGGSTVVIDLRKMPVWASFDDMPGESIAVSGICLTVVDVRDDAEGYSVIFDVSPETQARCLIGEWHPGKRVNIEGALDLRTRLGGHLVTGHIDCIGVVLDRASDGRFVRMDIETPGEIGRLIARKGSIAVDGVSLTTNEVADCAGKTRFTVMLVPHTLQATTLGAAKPGSRVHLEVDALARYVRRLLETDGQAAWTWQKYK
ncbi:MAG: riboflavin synthase [Gammaproteobacteria bacterium]